MVSCSDLLRRRTLSTITCSLVLLALTSCARKNDDLLRAEKLEHDGNWSQALTLYSHALLATPSSKRSTLAELQSHIGHCLIELGSGTDALISLEKALALDPNNLTAHLRLAQLFVIADVPDRAEEHIARVAATNPDDPEMLQVRAAMYAAEGHKDLAEIDLNRAYRLSQNRESVAEQLAQLYLDEDKLDQARSILTEASHAAPKNSRLLLLLARIDETEGDAAKAEAEYRAAIAREDTPENNRRLAQFLARDGRVPEAETILERTDAIGSGAPTAAADLELQSGRPQQALRSYEAAYGSLFAQKPKGAHATNRDVAEALSVRMIEADLALASAGDGFGLVAARKHLEQTSANLKPDTGNLLEAETDLLSGDLATAEQKATAAISRNSNSAPAEYLLGEIALRLGKPIDAVNHWQTAGAINPAYVPARIALASHALQQQNGPLAEQEIIGVVRDEPANLDALLIYARALLLEKRYDSARALAHRALAANPQDSQVPMLLGDIALDQHQLAVALVEYEKAMLLQPHSQQAIAGLTAVYEKGGADAALLHKLEKLALTGTPSSRLMEIAGRLYAWQHRYPDAVRCLRRAQEMDPDRSSVPLALAAAYAQKDPNAPASELLSQPEMQGLGKSGGNENSALVAALRAESRGDHGEAIRQYESAVRAGDPSGIASNNLAWLYAVEGKRLDHALELAKHALELNPGSPQVLDTIGMIHFENRQFSDAIASFQDGARRASQLPGMEDVRRTIEGHLLQALQVAGAEACPSGQNCSTWNN
jgi:tetratricopeptide (TPR) repeat protein